MSRFSNILFLLCLSTCCFAQQEIDTIYYDQRKTPRIKDTRFVVKIDTQMGSKSIGQYINGKAHGKWIYYRDNGELFKIEHYEMGKRNGCSTIFGPFGPTIVSNIKYLDSEEDGPQHNYDSNGVLAEEILWDSGYIMRRSTFYPNGQIKNEQKYWRADSLNFNSVFFLYDPVKPNAIINDSTNAIGDQWYENGQIKIKCVGSFDSILYLNFKYFNIDGVLLEQGQFIIECEHEVLCRWVKFGEWYRREY